MKVWRQKKTAWLVLPLTLALLLCSVLAAALF